MRGIPGVQVGLSDGRRINASVRLIRPYGYDVLDDLTAVTPPSGTGRSFSYSSMKRLNSAVNPETGTISYTYDANGNLATRAMGGTTTYYCYDPLDELTAKRYGSACTSSPDVTYSYVAGRRTAATYGSVSSAWTYDGLGRAKTSSQTIGSNTWSFPEYAWNLADSLKTELMPSGRTVNYTFDSAGRVSAVAGTLSGTPRNYVTGVSYAPHGAISGVTLGNGIPVATTYNPRFQATQIDANSGLLTLNYNFASSTNNGNVLSQKVTRQGQIWTQSYGYDNLNRLTCANEVIGATGPTCGTGTPGWQEQNGFDVRGNRWESSRSGLASATVETPAAYTWFDSNNRISQTGWTYDSACNLITITSTLRRFSYDAENRLICATQGSTTTPSTCGSGTYDWLEQYTYDADGHRVTKTTSSGTTTYVYDAGGQLASENLASAPGAIGTVYPITDSLGSTRLVTDSAGVVTKCSDYLPFGEEITQIVDSRPACFSAAEPATEAKFTGKERDAESGLDYFGARYFSSAQGRWTSPDEFKGGIVDPFTGQQISQPGPLPYA